MRCVVPLLLLGLLCGVSAQTFHITGADGNNGYWIIDGANDPDLTLTAGQTYVFSIEFNTNTGNHPFGLSTSETGTTVSELGLVANQNSSCTGTGTTGYKTTTTCSLTYQAPANPTTLYYHCAVHPNMAGKIIVQAAATASSSSSSSSTGGAGATSSSSSTGGTTGGATTAPPTVAPTTGGTLTGTSFRVTDVHRDAQNNFDGYIFTDQGKTYLNPKLSVTPGTSVVFSLEFPGLHPFGFSPKNSPTVTADKDNFPPPDKPSDLVVSNTCTQATQGIPVYTPTTPPTPCTLTVQVAKEDAGQTLYYRCSQHARMIGTITIGNTASRMAGAGLALMIAFIATIMA